jgi:DsbC/DsbD-like thiol-disulfide interchange protein
MLRPPIECGINNMSFPKSVFLITVIFMLLLAGCTRKAPDQTAQTGGAPIKSESVVKVLTSPVEIPAGGTADAIIQINVQNGYHINANPPTYPYLKPTEVELQPTNGMSVGFITYPTPLTKQFPFAEKPLAIYEGSTQVKVLLKASPTTKKESSNLSGKLKVQACDDQVCYPPGEIELTVPVTVK